PDTGIPVCSINGPPSFGDLLGRIERLVRQGQELVQLLRQPEGEMSDAAVAEVIGEELALAGVPGFGTTRIKNYRPFCLVSWDALVGLCHGRFGAALARSGDGPFSCRFGRPTRLLGWSRANRKMTPTTLLCRWRSYQSRACMKPPTLRTGPRHHRRIEDVHRNGQRPSLDMQAV